MLGLTKKTGFRERQDQREGRSQVRASDRAHGWFDKIRHRRIAVIKEGFRPEFDFPRRRREAPRVSLVIARSVLDVLRRQRLPYSSRLRPKLLQGDAAGTKLLPVSGVDTAVPEMLAKTETRGKTQDNIGIGAGLAGRRDDGLPKLNARLRLCTDFESDLESFAFEARRHRPHRNSRSEHRAWLSPAPFRCCWRDARARSRHNKRRAGRARSCGQRPPIGREQPSMSLQSFLANICCTARRSGRRPAGRKSD